MDTSLPYHPGACILGLSLSPLWVQRQKDIFQTFHSVIQGWGEVRQGPLEGQDADSHLPPGQPYPVSCQAVKLASLPLSMFPSPFCWLLYTSLDACMHAAKVHGPLGPHPLKLHSVGLDGHVHGLGSPFGICIMMELRPGLKLFLSSRPGWVSRELC